MGLTHPRTPVVKFTAAWGGVSTSTRSDLKPENGVEKFFTGAPPNSNSILDGVLACRRTTQEAVAKESKALRPQGLGEYVRRHQFRLQVAELCVFGLDKVASKVVLDIDMAGSLRYVRDLGELDDSLVVLSNKNWAKGGVVEVYCQGS